MEKTTSKNLYQDYRIYKPTEKKHHKKRIFIIVFLCLVLFSVVIIFSINKIRQDKDLFNKNAYLVVVGKYNNVANAKDAADKVETAGGAGFVWVEDTFWVVAFVYPTKEAAENVQKQLTSSSWRAVVEKKELKRVKKSKLTNSQYNASELLWLMMNDFYDYACMVDVSEKDNAKVHKKLASLRQEVSLVLNSLGETDVDLLFKDRLTLIYDELESFLKASYPKTLYASGIKLLCVKAVYACVGLWDEVQKLL